MEKETEESATRWVQSVVSPPCSFRRLIPERRCPHQSNACLLRGSTGCVSNLFRTEVRFSDSGMKQDVCLILFAYVIIFWKLLAYLPGLAVFAGI